MLHVSGRRSFDRADLGVVVAVAFVIGSWKLITTLVNGLRACLPAREEEVQRQALMAVAWSSHGGSSVPAVPAAADRPGFGP